MACGCSDTSICSCIVTGVNGVSVSGAGTSGNPYQISPPAETPFAATNTGGGIAITPAGAYGHTPNLDLTIDPTSTATVTVSGAGLKVDVPPAGAVPLDVVTASLTLTPAHGVVIVDSQTPAAPVQVSLPASSTAGQRYEIKDYGTSGTGFTTTQAVSVNPNGNNIDGSGSVRTFSTNGESMTVISVDGLNWAII